MPGLISSAASGKAAAPKAPPRRRPPQSSKGAAQPSGDAFSVTLPTPPHTQVPAEQATETASSFSAQPIRDAASPGVADSTPTTLNTPDNAAEESTAVSAPHTITALVPEETQTDIDSSIGSTVRQERSTPLVRPDPLQVQHTHVIDDVPRTSTNRGTATVSPPLSAQVTRSSAKRTRATGSDAALAPTSKRPKRTSTRSNTLVQAAVRDDSQEGQRTTAVPSDQENAQRSTPAEFPLQLNRKQKPNATSRTRKGRLSVRSAANVVNSDEEDEATESGVDEVAVELVHESERPAEQQAPTPPAKPKAKIKRRRRRATRPHEKDGEEADEQAGQEAEEGPDSAEEHEIDPQTLSMFDLSLDSYHGKQSQREKEMALLPWDEIAQKRRDELEKTTRDRQPAIADDVVPSTEGPDGAAGSSPAVDSTAAENRPQRQIQYRLNEAGEIEVDDESLAVDREAGALAAAHNENQPVEEDNDLTRRLNRTTWINANRRDPDERGLPMWKTKSDPWNEVDTDRFYEALAMIGTDFFIISKMFHPRTRRMIKMKFIREERIDPKRVNAALLGKSTKPVDLEHYARESGRDMAAYTKYEGYDHAKAMIDASLADKESVLTAALLEEEANAVAEKERREKEKGQKKMKKEGRRKGKKNMEPGLFGGGGGMVEDVDAGVEV